MVFHLILKLEKSYLDFNLKIQRHSAGEIYALVRVILDLLSKIPQSKQMQQCLTQEEDMSKLHTSK